MKINYKIYDDHPNNGGILLMEGFYESKDNNISISKIGRIFDEDGEWQECDTNYFVVTLDGQAHACSPIEVRKQITYYRSYTQPTKGEEHAR